MIQLQLAGGIASVKDGAGEDTKFSMGTGLLPAWLGFTGTTRQNDLDVSFTISIQPSTSDNSTTGDGGTMLTRQAFLTFGDASWGTVKMGKDLGIFASHAILNDITLARCWWCLQQVVLLLLVVSDQVIYTLRSEVKLLIRLLT